MKPVKYVNHSIRAVLLLALLFAASGCTITEGLTFTNTETHESAFDFTVEDFFIAVLQDFSEFVPPEGDESLMDKAISDFQRALDYSSTTDNVRLTKLNDNAYQGTFTFNNLQQLITDLGAGSNQSLLKMQKNSMTFFLSMDNYEQLVPVIPFLADENFEAFGPVYNQGLSEADYLEMISFMLGEEGPPAIEQSVITLQVKTPTSITGFSNGRKISDTLYEFSFPLIDFLLLEDPITFSVSWK
ncbi:MAG: hypothetical protein AB7D24_03755 [Sphaerochaeta sp.]|jgi:hypothetical protein|uniref:hypothetical protein n=1 Tax=unclassified Sphaerochaeta TaxID=2637943 RepID=UPI000A8C5FE4|nr:MULTISPECIES: hypothetical protein [unclassified Sphaerochaeta]MCK9602332.1 hypothetical protein [Sphaerochaeta sp.]MDX9825146.1 hypothetical protein [Sphaerochaeta sp.]HPE93584.1 hypothetical protein [Sphaerochaeta sp.]